LASEEYTEAEQNSTVLQQVREALGRVADGTFGKCIVSGGPVEERRLEAVPGLQSVPRLDFKDRMRS
jgi:DnaK suppressor protein